MGGVEEWRPIVGFEGLYEVSSLGRVRSLDCMLSNRNRWGTVTTKLRKGRILKVDVDNRGGGYSRVSLSTGGEVKNAKVHILVCTAFHGAKPPGGEVAHGDGDTSNNVAQNLRWATGIENAADAKLHGTAPVGSQHPAAILDEQDVVHIRQMSGTHREVADRFGVSMQTIKDVRLRRRWRHVE